ncbi:Scr1 family TA system antitoxin-like transcriptional regulator [Streptomyces sp. NPDC052013]
MELDSTHGPEFIDAEAQLSKYRAQLDAAQALALTPPASRDFIRDLAHGV